MSPRRGQSWPEALCFQVVCSFHSCEQDISRMPLGYFFKFGTDHVLDLRMNLLEFGGQSSRSQ